MNHVCVVVIREIMIIIIAGNGRKKHTGVKEEDIERERDGE